MSHRLYPQKVRQIHRYFENASGGDRPELLAPLETLAERQDLPSATALLDTYFEKHRPGDLRNLRQVVSAFADKGLVKALVKGILQDEPAMARIAAQSYPHPIGFDKLVLHDHTQDGPARRFKLRLHVYWRTPQELQTEFVHLHRFEMASSPITGELTNHLYKVRRADDPQVATRPGDGPVTRMHAYTGYARDPDGTLHKRHLGAADLEQKSAVTFVPGQTYVQALHQAHFVETNAETGHTNGDVCSTIYVHGPSLADAHGRTLPILFDTAHAPDEVITPIPSLTMSALDGSLRRYLSLLEESLRFYDWLYDPRYGRNLSVGMIAGYFLSEAFGTDKTIDMWQRHRAACEDVLESRTAILQQLIHGDLRIDALPADDRNTRYFQALVNKSYEHPEDPKAWLAAYGHLVTEFERYLGALIGDYARNPEIKVLKPIWTMSARINLKSGAHYGHIWAMLETLRRVRPQVMAKFRDRSMPVEHAASGPVTEVDRHVERTVRQVLQEHFPEVPFVGEELKRHVPREEGARRWLVDPIDGTRNFIHGNKNFAISIAHQRVEAGKWVTTDAVVALPAHQETYWAERGKGAYRIDHDGIETRLKVPDTPVQDGPLVDLSIRGFGPRAFLFLSALIRERIVVRQTGCAALMLSMVTGSGNAGAVITAHNYDVAAGLLIAAEAGATWSDHCFHRDDRDFTAYVAAESEALHAHLRNLVTAALQGLD